MRKHIIILFFFLFTGMAYAQVAHQTKAGVIDSLLTSCYADGLFNGVALVADEGEIILHKSYGVADLENYSPLKLSDRFYIGSLTKQFTSVLIFKLQEEGFLDINHSISTYLKEFNTDTFAAITIHQLLTHTSGLGSYTAHPDFDRSVPYSEEEMIEFIKHPLLFEPGTDWSYSNSGYFLLGKVAERVTNKNYGTLLREKIFEPLQMRNTAFSDKWLDEKVAKGYRRTIEGIEPMPSYAAATLFSTGGIYATAHDLFIWAQALDENQLLSEKSKEILFQPLRNNYACGLYVKKGMNEDGSKFERHFHGGMIQGYHTFMLKRVPQQQVVILLDNFYHQEIQTIKNRIWSALIGEEVKGFQPKLSKFLYSACAEKKLAKAVDSISNNLELFESQYTFEEFDINSVAYQLMEANRDDEAALLFAFNLNKYPKSWNVYDSMGELQLKQKKYSAAEKLYKKSLVLNPQNTSAERALERIKQQTTTDRKKDE